MPAYLPVAAWGQDWPALAIVLGLVLLVLGADLLVRGAVWIALVLGVGPMTIGLTLVAFGTSMPELMVSFTAAQLGSSEIALANAIGSNTFNILLIVGATAVIKPIRLPVDWLELGYMLLATLLAGVPFVLGRELGRPLAAVMVTMLVLFCVQLVRRERRRGSDRPSATRPRATVASWLLHLAFTIGGLVLLKFGAEWLVDGSIAIARSLGMTEALIGMTLVAGGTSLPELFTSVVAARKGQPEIAIGNIVGSNVFNVGAVLGCAGLLRPFAVDPVATGALMLMTLLSAVWLTLSLRLHDGVTRRTGVMFLLGYAGYLGWEAWRTGAL